ncbi:MAG: tryptophan synthase subunit alpha [Candidatus Margulisiibacteriota bacterium]
MPDIKNIFKKGKLLIPYITAGDPNLAATEELILGLEKNGADIIELGIPFSDSLADGPTIVASHMRALDQGTSLKKVLAMVKNIRKKTQIPLIFMLSYNLIYKFGIPEFVREVESCSVSGYIIPDLPPEETPKELKPIYLVTPTTTKQRMKMIVNKSSHFIYLVSTTGVTGARESFPSSLKALIKEVKKVSPLPVAVGFGISSPAQAKSIAELADGVIIGSALVKLTEKSTRKALAFINDVKQAMKL